MFRWTVTKKQSGVPTGVSRAAVAAVGHKLYCFDVHCEWKSCCKDHVDVNVFDTVSLCWTKVTPVTPGRGERPPRSHFITHRGHTAMLVEAVVYVWGGNMHTSIALHCNVLHAFDVDTHRWFKPRTSGAVPESRHRHSACVLGKIMYIYGGCKPRTGYYNDIYKLDTATMVWSLINTRGTPPLASEGHSATIVGTKMFVIVGTYHYTNHYTIRAFDTETDCWLNMPSQKLPLDRHWLRSPFAYNEELYITGWKPVIPGWNPRDGPCGGPCERDLWKLDQETCSLRKCEPKGRCGTFGTSHMAGDRVILFGGYNYNDSNFLDILDLSPSLKTLCKLAVIQYDGLQRSELPHNVRWELTAMVGQRGEPEEKFSFI